MTTPFQSNLAVDYRLLESQIHTFIQSGCRGIVARGSLGEAPVLQKDAKIEILSQVKHALRGRARPSAPRPRPKDHRSEWAGILR
jgi:dihydrodipicolinate synthase/N-acetylneuraminate lyase